MTAGEARDLVATTLARQLTRWEVRLDHAIHAGAIAVALVGVIALIVIAAAQGGVADIAVVSVYSTGLLAMLACSAAYSIGRSSRIREVLRGIDQSAIFLMIAGSYTPFTVLYLEGGWRIALTALIWSLAVFCIALRLIAPRVFHRLAVGLYLSLGWVGLVAFVPLVQAMDAVTFGLLVAGGLLYSVGIVFHLWERLPFQNVIWHGFVVAAASVHYAAIAGSVAATSPL